MLYEYRDPCLCKKTHTQHLAVHFYTTTDILPKTERQSLAALALYSIKIQ